MDWPVQGGSHKAVEWAAPVVVVNTSDTRPPARPGQILNPDALAAVVGEEPWLWIRRDHRPGECRRVRLLGFVPPGALGPEPFRWFVYETEPGRADHPGRGLGWLIGSPHCVMSLADAGVIPYPNGRWNTSNWLTLADEQADPCVVVVAGPGHGA